MRFLIRASGSSSIAQYRMSVAASWSSPVATPIPRFQSVPERQRSACPYSGSGRDRCRRHRGAIGGDGCRRRLPDSAPQSGRHSRSVGTRSAVIECSRSVCTARVASRSAGSGRTWRSGARRQRSDRDRDRRAARPMRLRVRGSDGRGQPGEFRDVESEITGRECVRGRQPSEVAGRGLRGEWSHAPRKHPHVLDWHAYSHVIARPVQ